MSVDYLAQFRTEVRISSTRPTSNARSAVSSSLSDQMDRLPPILTALLRGEGAQQGVDELEQALLLHVTAPVINFNSGVHDVYVTPHAETKSVTAHTLLDMLQNTLRSCEQEWLCDGTSILLLTPIDGHPDRFFVHTDWSDPSWRR